MKTLQTHLASQWSGESATNCHSHSLLSYCLTVSGYILHIHHLLRCLSGQNYNSAQQSGREKHQFFFYWNLLQMDLSVWSIFLIVLNLKCWYTDFFLRLKCTFDICLFLYWWSCSQQGHLKHFTGKLLSEMWRNIPRVQLEICRARAVSFDLSIRLCRGV